MPAKRGRRPRKAAADAADSAVSILLPQIELFHSQVKPQPWGNEELVARTETYTGKVLHRLGGSQYHRAGLQYHPTRDETFHMFSGVAWVYFVKDQQVYKFLMKSGMSVHVPAGAIHSVQTLGNSVMFEASVPDDTEPRSVNVEDQYDVSMAIEIPAEKL